MTRIHVPIHLRWGDLDAFGHVNNVTLMKHLEEARIRAFWLHEVPGESRDTAVFDESYRGGEHGPFLTLIARNEVEYLLPIPYTQDPLDVRMWFGKLGGSSADLFYEVWGSGGDGQVLYARAASMIVLADQETGRPVRMPDAVRSAWEPYLGEPISFSRR